MKSVTVSTTSELKLAKDKGYDEIIVIGVLANKLKKQKVSLMPVLQLLPF